MKPNEKFQRFLEMTDHPERFPDEELVQLSRDPELAAWYRTLAEVEATVKKDSVPLLSHRGTKLRYPVSPQQKGNRKLLKRLWTGAVAAAVAVLLIVNPLQKKPVTAPPVRKETVVVENEGTGNHETVVESKTLAQAEEHPSNKKMRKRPYKQQPRVEEYTVSQLQEEQDILQSDQLTTTCTTALPHSERDGEGLLAIPPDKQALAEIYLAEMALQVAYEQQAVQERVRAYAASLMTNKTEDEQPIIAF